MTSQRFRIRGGLIAAVLATAVAFLGVAPSSAASAEGSNGTIRLINGFAAGGSTDIVTRLLADKLRTSLGRPVVVENKVGAGGQLAVLEVKNAAPDGATLLLSPSSPVSLYVLTYPNLPYDPLRDLAPISRVTSFDFAVTAGPKVPAASLAELVEWLKLHPGQANYGTAGAGTLLHFVGLRLGQETGVELTHIPYRGGSAALVDLLGGSVPLMVDSPAPTIEAHRQGRLRILAVTGPERSDNLPEVPTLKESGVDFVAESYIGLFGPAGLPPELAGRLNAAVAEAVASPEFREAVVKLGMRAESSSPQALGEQLVRDIDEWGPIVRQSGFTSEQ